MNNNPIFAGEFKIGQVSDVGGFILLDPKNRMPRNFLFLNDISADQRAKIMAAFERDEPLKIEIFGAHNDK